MSEQPSRELVAFDVADGVGTIRLDRPPMNALSMRMQDELGALAAEIGAREDVRAVLLRGSEKVFAAGADIKEMRAMSYTDMVRRGPSLQAALTAVARLPQPVVAAVNGYALGGGCELALCADVRICAENVKFGQPEIQLGLIPGAGGTQRLPRLVGPAKAKDLIFTGRHVRAEEALRIGLADQVVPTEEVYERAHDWARQFVNAPAYALRAAKEAVDRGMETDLDTGLAVERDRFAGLFATEDSAIGMRSFEENGPGKATFR